MENAEDAPAEQTPTRAQQPSSATGSGDSWEREFAATSAPPPPRTQASNAAVAPEEFHNVSHEKGADP